MVTSVLLLARPQPQVSRDPMLLFLHTYSRVLAVLANAEIPQPPATGGSPSLGDARDITIYSCATGGSRATMQAAMAGRVPVAGWTPPPVNGVRLCKPAPVDGVGLPADRADHRSARVGGPHLLWRHYPRLSEAPVSFGCTALVGAADPS